MSAHVNDEELLWNEPDGRVHLAWGTVGWPGDADVLDGLGRDQDDGMTFVKVTLVDGAPVGQRQADDGGANGVQVRVHPAGPGWRIPPRGTRVMVGFAGGDIWTPGNGVILAEVGRSPARHFGRKKVILDYGDADVVITGRSVTLLCDGNPAGESDRQKRHVVSVSPEGGAQVASGGCGLFVQGKDAAGNVIAEAQLKTVDKDGNLKSSLVLTQSAVGLADAADPMKPAALTLTGGNATITSTDLAVQATGSVMLGATASPATPAASVPPGPPSPGTASARVFLAMG